jgi:HPr kinase/phosphorylase
MHKSQPFHRESITVEFLVEQLRDRVGVMLEAVNDFEPEVVPAERRLTESNLHRPGLALAGYTDLFTHQRVQILGNTEVQYLDHLDGDARIQAFDNLVQFEIPCLFLTNDNTLPDALIRRPQSARSPFTGLRCRRRSSCSTSGISSRTSSRSSRPSTAPL